MAPRDDRFRKYQEAGADFLETARARAEDFLRELSKAGESTQRQGKDALDDLLEGSRKGTEQLIGSIRDEVRSQLSLLGLATKEDLAALERRLGGASKTAAAKKTATSKSTASKAPAARKTAAKKASGSTKSAGTTRKTTAKSTAKRSTPAKKATGRA